MITDDDVMSLFEQADPAGTTDHHATPDATGYLAALRQRSNNVTYIHPTENLTANPAEEPGRPRRVAMIAAAAAAVVLVVGALVVAARDDEGGQEVPATVPPTDPATTSASTNPSVAAVDDPLGLATGFLAAFATGDPTTVANLQTDDFEMRYSWPNEQLGAPLAEYDWLGGAYQIGHETTYTDPSCFVVYDVDGVAGVQCATVMELALHRLTNTEGLGASVTLRLTDDGVLAMDSAYATNFGFGLLRPFDEWREANRPGALPDGDNDPQTAAESLEHAQTEAQLVAEWVDWATIAVESALAQHNAGDVDAFLAGFGQGVDVLGVDGPNARAVFAALMAGDQTYETANCEPDGIDRGLAIVCDVVIRPPAHEHSGVVLTGTIRMIVTAEGTILSDADDVDSQPFDQFNTVFEQWLLTAHPDVHAQVDWVVVDESRIPSADDQALVAPYYEEFVAQSRVYPLAG